MAHQRISVSYKDKTIQLVIIKLISIDSQIYDKFSTLTYLAYNHGTLYELIVTSKQLTLLEQIKAMSLNESLVIGCRLKVILKGIISEELDSELAKKAKFELRCDYYVDIV